MTDKITKFIEENSELKEYISSLENQSIKLESEVNNLKTVLTERDVEIKLLKEAMVLSRAKKFGSSSEKTVKGQMSLEFFDEAEKESNLNAAEPTVEKVVKKKRKSRTDNISNLETEVIEYTLSDSELICPNCNTPLKKMSEESRETIKLYKKVIRLIEKRAIYSCPKCSLVVKAPMPKLPIEGSLASSSTLAQVIVDKYANGLPLYRQSQDYSRIGLNLSRQTLSNWMMKSSELLDIIYNQMISKLLSFDTLHADETSLQVLKETGKPAKTKSYMWLYRTGRFDTPIVIYDYKSSRSGEIPRTFLKDFNGYLHVDGYAGYQAVDNVTLVGCLAHVRRYFNDAYISLGNMPGIEDTATAKGLSYCNKLFALDKESKTLDLDKRLIFKQEKIKPLFVEFLTWVNNSIIDAMPKSKYGKALKYASNQLPNVMHYLEKAELDIDNNLAERSIKPFVIGRKNWLFSNTASGADASARLYSIVQTCILNNVNPYEYLDYALDKLANMTVNQNSDILGLLPWNYSKN